jgi:hypothetical protein
MGRYMLGAVSRCYQRFVLPSGRVVLAAELGRFAADTDTAPGFRERLHNQWYTGTVSRSGCRGDGTRRDTGTGSSDVPILP